MVRIPCCSAFYGMAVWCCGGKCISCVLKSLQVIWILRLSFIWLNGNQGWVFFCGFFFHILQLHCIYQSVVKELEAGSGFLWSSGSGRWIEVQGEGQNFSSRSSCSCYMLSLGEKGGFLKSFWGSMCTVQADGAFCMVSPKMDTRLGSDWVVKGNHSNLQTGDWTKVNCSLCLPNITLCGDDYFIAAEIQPFFSWEIQFCRLAASDTVPGDAELDSDLPISTDDTFVFTKGIIILSLEAQQCGMPVGPRRPGGLIPWPSALKLLLSAPWWSQAVTSGWPGCCTVRWVHIWLFSAFSALPACF